MKKIIILAVCLLAIVSCKQKQAGASQDAAPEDSVQTSEAANNEGGIVTPGTLNEQWKAKSIKVENGGENPNIYNLLNAFHKVWNTNSVETLLNKAKDPKFSYEDDMETGGSIMIERKNGYAQVTGGDTDEESMAAALWKCNNGHRLFIIKIFKPLEDNRSLPAEQAVCCYDYDPQTETMTPKQNNITQFKAKQGNYAVYNLPREGTTFSIMDSNQSYEGTYHIFVWDGKQFTEDNAYTNDQLFKQANGTWRCNEEGKPKITFQITNDKDHYWAITDCGIWGSTEFDVDGSDSYGFIEIAELGEEESDAAERNPSFSCKLWLTKNGQLKGTYYLRMNGGKESKGEVTLEKQSELEQYSE